MSEIQDWDVAAANNNSAAPDGWPEGMVYSSVNNTGREGMAVLARHYKDTNGSLSSGGSSNAYTLTPNRTISSYSTGLEFAFKANHANTGAVTLNVSSLGAKSIKNADGSDLKPSQIPLNGICRVVYDGTQFQLANITPSLIGNKNLLINGDGVICQRALSSINDDTYSFDRWIVLSDGNGIVTPSQETSDLPAGARSGMKLTVDIANKKFGLLQIVEGKNCKHIINSVASLSAQAKSSGLSNLRVAILSWTGTEDSVTSDVVSAWNAAGSNPTLATNWTYENTPANISLSTSWASTYQALNTSIDTASTKQVAVFLWVDDTDAAISDYLIITEAQLEKGAVATEFEYRAKPVEQTLCERYCEKSYSDGDYAGDVASAGSLYFTIAGAITNAPIGSVSFKTKKRTTPTVTIYSPVTGAAGKGRRTLSSAADRTVQASLIGTAGFTANYNDVSDSDNIYAIHYLAEAEL